ncbi:MAG TPA: hypothetical protein VL326_29670 [Kofleriaceae bacterium]|jgi:hypothetical protein|nr:hypothetical protein [Kofleriaceae bacterium]
MRAWAVALVALAGCDRLFEITHVDPTSVDAMSTIDTPPDATHLCPGDYHAIPGAPDVSLYRWNPAQLIWSEAEADCEDDSPYPITHLLVFDRPGEMEAVRAALNAMFFNQFASHTGYARNVLDNPYEFYAVTGEPVPQTRPPWNMGEPTGTVGPGEETTVRFESFTDLIDQPWDFPLSSLCECDQRPVTKTFTLNR